MFRSRRWQFGLGIAIAVFVSGAIFELVKSSGNHPVRIAEAATVLITAERDGTVLIDRANSARQGEKLIIQAMLSGPASVGPAYTIEVLVRTSSDPGTTRISDEFTVGQ